ncbi:MAG: SH3 domain-containing protein [Candidatus Omnitrophica bacterium]|nr:SH3 domain-containing protein [Candidatus Omnitrophota bacterium]
MKKTINVLIICLIFFCFSNYRGDWCFAQEKASVPYSGIITGDSVSVRSGPGVNFEKLRKMDQGDAVLVVDPQNEQWLKIKLPRNSKAFVHKDFLVVENSVYGVISGERVNVRAGEGTNFNIIGQLNPDDRVEIILKGRDWFQIYPYENCFAWVHRDFVKKSGPAKIYIDNEAEKREGFKLLIEAEIFEKENKTAAIDKRDISPIIQKYKLILRDYAQSPANEKTRLHIERLSKINTQIQRPQGQTNNEPGTEKSKKAILMQPDSKPDAQGKITEAGKFFNRPGTHRLVKDGRTHYFLKSETVNLNDHTYHQVQIWGQIKSSEKSKIPVIEVDFIKNLN